MNRVKTFFRNTTIILVVLTSTIVLAQKPDKKTEILVSPKIDNIGFGAQGHVQKSRNHEHEGFEGFPITKSKSY